MYAKSSSFLDLFKRIYLLEKQFTHSNYEIFTWYPQDGLEQKNMKE